MQIRTCGGDEQGVMEVIINAAAEAYRGVIPSDCFHEPYMSAEELAREIADGVAFWGCESAGRLVGVMGIQSIKGQALIRHAYVRPDLQNQGIGSKLLEFLIAQQTGSILVGTWAAARWAIAFYEKHGFVLTGRAETVQLLRTYWTVSERQIETSVVLRREA